MVDDLMQNRLDFGDAHSVADQALKVVTARFQSVEPFSWNVFDGFDRLRVLTYSASAQTIVRMLERYPFAYFECIFGYEEGLVADVVKPHQILNNPAGDYAIQWENERQRVIFERMQAGRARFYVVKDSVAHAKLYLLETNGGERRRVIVGSANLSERAFGGKQSETLVVFDNDAQAWEHYSHEYNAVKESASYKIDMPVGLQATGIGSHTYTEQKNSTTATSPIAAREIALQLEREGIAQRKIADRLNELGYSYTCVNGEEGPFTQQRVWHLLNPRGVTERESRLNSTGYPS